MGSAGLRCAVSSLRSHSLIESRLKRQSLPSLKAGISLYFKRRYIVEGCSFKYSASSLIVTILAMVCIGVDGRLFVLDQFVVTLKRRASWLGTEWRAPEIARHLCTPGNVIRARTVMYLCPPSRWRGYLHNRPNGRVESITEHIKRN